MKRSAIVKIVVDVWMTLLLLFLMGYQLWGEVAHEWAGAGMLVLFLAHHILNRGWYKSLFKGRYMPMRVFQVLVDMLLLAAMAAQMYSGIAMSRHVFAFLPVDGGMALARRLHILGACWGFILMSVHLGMHWNMFLGMARKRAGKAVPSKLRSLLLFLIGLLIAAYGAFVFVNRDFPTYLFLRSEFVFLDYEEPVWSFYPDYLCLMGLWTFLAHYLFPWQPAAICRPPKKKHHPVLRRFRHHRSRPNLPARRRVMQPKTQNRRVRFLQNLQSRIPTSNHRVGK